MKSIHAFLAIVFFSSCYTTHQNKSKNKETSFIVDKLYFQKNGTDNLYVHDLLGINIVSYSLVPDKICKVIIDKPSLVSVNTTHYIVYPGENINIKYNDNEDVLFKIDGNKQRNNEFNYQLNLEKIRHSLVPKIADSLQHKSIDSILDFEVKLNEQILVYLKRLSIASDSLSSLLKISDSFKLMSNANLQNEFISIKSQFNFIFQKKLKQNSLYLQRQYDILKLLNEIQNPYQVTLYGNNYVYDLARDLLPNKIKKLQNEAALINNINILDSNFKGITKDYILGKQMFEFLKTNSIISNKAYRYYKKKSVSNEYTSIIKNIRAECKSFSKQSKKYKYDRLIVASNLK